MNTKKVKELFNYVDGSLYWRANKNRARAGSAAGCIHKTGYRVIRVDGVDYKAHHLVWIWHGNKKPSELDHINGNKLDNNIDNLRLSTHSENMRNTGLRKDNSLGVKGVDLHKNGYRARITLNSKTRHLGFFSSLEAAMDVLNAARKQVHGLYAREK